ncbi:MAG TPA: DUF4337 family protein [Polyangiaceae bacterium]|nr:DUF4337 family protein [Polyangiaceae bacterium]
MSLHELAEKIEHAHHSSEHPGGGHGAGGPSKQIGITMALLGVLLAFSAAMVGSQRTELIKSMVLQSSKWGFYQAETMKFRVLQADFELLKSISPKKDEIEKVETTLRTKRGPRGTKDDEDTAELKDLIASATEDMADLLTPDASELTRFRKMSREFERDMREAKEDADAYDLSIEAHQEAAERYEWAQLSAEIGIVIASIALLLGSRKVWAVSILLAVTCTGALAVTYVRTAQALTLADKKIDDAAKNVVQLEHDDDDDETPATATSPSAPPHAPPSASAHAE